MKIVLFLCLFLALISVVLSAVAFAPKPSGKPGDCYVDIVGPLKLGEKKYPKSQCVEVACGEDGLARLVGCGAIAGPHTDIDLSKDYPKCCPQPIRS